MNVRGKFGINFLLDIINFTLIFNDVCVKIIKYKAINMAFKAFHEHYSISQFDKISLELNSFA